MITYQVKESDESDINSSEDENTVESDGEQEITSMDIVFKHKKIIERDIWSLSYKIEERKELLQKIKRCIQKNCEHEFVIDYIDSMENYHKGSQKIIYCKKCEITKPFANNFNLNTSNNKDD